MLSIPIVAGSLMRFPLGLLAQYIGRKNATLVEMVGIALAMLYDYFAVDSFNDLLAMGVLLGIAGASFDNSVVLVTGGAGGIGAATARLFAERGATVIAADLRAPVAGLGPDLEFLALDVTSEQSWAECIAHIVARHGQLDVLVNAAGIVGDVVAGTLEHTTLAQWRKVMAVNLDGTFLGCREAMAAMAARGRGAIVNLSSVGAYYPTTQSVAYGASKGAVTQPTKSVALFGSDGGWKLLR